LLAGRHRNQLREVQLFPMVEHLAVVHPIPKRRMVRKAKQKARLNFEAGLFVNPMTAVISSL
jgi:hypothetical protein